MKYRAFLHLLAAFPVVAATPGLTSTHFPLLFETNLGQAADPAVRFLARGRGAAVGLGAQEASLVLRRAGGSGARVRMILEGADPAASIHGLDRQSTRIHYYAGQDPSRWLTDVPAWGRVEVSGVYPGIDLVWYGREGELEHDFRVAPNADAARIRLRFQGAEGLRIDAAGDLVVALAGGEVRLPHPTIYQEVGGERRAVQGGFRLRSAGEAGFAVGAYDHSRALVIDPVIRYAAFVGGSADDKGTAVAADPCGNTYLAGTTSSADFAQSLLLPAGFIAKVNAIGNQIDYLTIINHRDPLRVITIDADCRSVTPSSIFGAVATGPASQNLPLTRTHGTPLSANDPGGMVVFRLDGQGKLVSSILINGGGLDWPTGLSTDAFDNIVVTGESNSPDFPRTKLYGVDPAQSPNDPKHIVAFKLDRNDNLVYSTWLNGSGPEENAHIAADWQGNAYLAIDSRSRDFPRTRLVGVDPVQLPTDPEHIVGVKLDRDGNLVHAVWLNGSYKDSAVGIAVDPLGNAYIAAESHSIDFPLTRLFGTPLQPGGAVLPCLTVAIKLDNGKPVYIHGFNGSGMQEPAGIAVDLIGRPYLVGVTDSTDFPFTEQLGQTGQSATRMFVLRLGITGGLRDAIGIGGGSLGATPTGIGVDGFGRVHLGGYTSSPDFPATQDSLGPKPFGGVDAFLMRLSNFALQ